MRHVFVRVLGVLTLAIVALLPVNARASRPRPPSEPEAMALQGRLGVARYSGLPMDAPSPWWSQAAGVAAGPGEFEPSALGLGSLPSTQRREAGTFDPLQGIALVDVDRIRGPPGLQLENRTWTLQILGQSVVVVAEGVSTRLVWSCGGPKFDAAWYDCGRSEYEGSASLRKLQSLWHVLEYDEQTRPCYAKYRWYDPETGSFVSADPLGFPDSMNQYAWGVGNYWKADPLGLAEEEDYEHAAFLHERAAVLYAQQLRDDAITSVRKAEFEIERDRKTNAGYFWEAIREQPSQSPQTQALRKWNNLGAEANAAVRRAWKFDEKRKLDPSLVEAGGGYGQEIQAKGYETVGEVQGALAQGTVEVTKGAVEAKAFALGLGGLAKKAKTGPKPQGVGPHNLKIEEVARQVNARGHRVVAGGGRGYPPEAVVATSGGYHNTRRPDILVERPDGTQYVINVGKTEKKTGLPIKRERKAIEDLEGPGGLETHFVPYDR